MQSKALQLSVRLLVLLLMLGLVFLLIGRPAEAEAPVLTSEYVVSEGDTLWGIAKGVSPEGSDPRQMVSEIQLINGLDGATIHPGQILLVPGGSPSL
ncbi:MAG: LysM peptidoglycan-binding domain-containing protein [Acidimicrobiia bacterium]|nr:LysM peptidoglycan-binding domain-containing protein [Acidimicrobiia bacterium]MDH3462743.1 LysM peptidoglycan-binding domain-containing protein [Acidimicrobiia bacterium]